MLVGEEDKAGPLWSALRPETMPIRCPGCNSYMPDPWMLLCNAHTTLAPKYQQLHKVKCGTGRTQLASRAMPEMLQLQGIH